MKRMEYREVCLFRDFELKHGLLIDTKIFSYRISVVCILTISFCLQADILVSELLGSFGDNELSPECLDGAQRFLKGTSSCFSLQYQCTFFYEVVFLKEIFLFRNIRFLINCVL